MTYKEAVTKSVLTLRTSDIILVDKSSGRGNKPLYLYKVLSGKAIKPAKNYKKKYPIYFIAYKDILGAKTADGAVVVFIENIQNNKILTRQRNIKYQWMNDAPQVTVGVSETPALKNKQPVVQCVDTATSTNPINRRPDADKYLTWEEANDWYRNGHGQPLRVDISKINMSGVWESNFPRGIGSKEPIPLSALNESLVYGTIIFKYLGDGKVIAVEPSTYNFDYKPWNGIKNACRNLKTMIKKWYVGDGQPFKIHFEGEGKIGKDRK